MAVKKIDDSHLSSVAAAIRSKGGTFEELIFPEGFIEAIDQIDMGTVLRATGTIVLNAEKDVAVYCGFRPDIVFVYNGDAIDGAGIDALDGARCLIGATLNFKENYITYGGQATALKIDDCVVELLSTSSSTGFTIRVEPNSNNPNNATYFGSYNYVAVNYSHLGSNSGFTFPIGEDATF